MYREIWLVMLIVGFILFIISLALIGIWGIFDLIGELTGRKSKKQIKRMQDLNSFSTGTSNELLNEKYASILSTDTGSGEFTNDNSDLKITVSNQKVDKEVIGGVKEYDENLNKVATKEEFKSTDSEDVATSYVSCVDDENNPTSYIDEEDDNPTSYIGEEDNPTSYIGEDLATTFLEGAFEIKVLEEQSSI